MMISKKSKKYIQDNYNINTDNYSENELKQLLEKIISRNDRIILINCEKANLLKEYSDTIESHLGKSKAA